MYISEQDYLMHHGVKGMKWGVRHDPATVSRRRVTMPVKKRKFLTPKQAARNFVHKQAVMARAQRKANKKENEKIMRDLAKELSAYYNEPADELVKRMHISRTIWEVLDERGSKK